MAYSVNSSTTIAPLTSLPFRALGDQPALDEAGIEDLTSSHHVAVLSYVRRDGRPNQAPVWFAMREGVMLITIATGSAKHHALKRDPRVSLVIQDERPPYRALIIDGIAELSALPADAELSYDTAVHYFGRVGADRYWKMTEDDRARTGTTMLTIVPSEVKGFDNAKAIGRTLAVFARLRNRLPLPRRWF